MSLEDNARAEHSKGNNCAISVYRAYAEKLGLSADEAMKVAPKPRAEGGKCGAYLAGMHIIEQLKPEAAAEFDRQFKELNNDETACAKLLMARRTTGKTCNDLVGDAARILEGLLKDE